MKKIFATVLILIAGFSAFGQHKTSADVCKVGVYITSIYDLNLSENSINADFWLWFNYENDSLKPLETVEIANAKEFSFSSGSTEKKGNIVWATQKVKSVLKKQWDVTNFPFDKEKIYIEIEDAVKDTSALRYLADTLNSRLDEDIYIEGWSINKFTVKPDSKTYNTTYGDPQLHAKSTYPRITVTLEMQRKGMGLFYKLFTGVYVAFLIAVLVFFIDPVDVDPRFGLSVGGLFAAVGNKYIVDSILPETTAFTLVDKVHSLTFAFILLSIVLSVISLAYYKGGYEKISRRIDRSSFFILSAIYLIINIIFISQAI
jgi:hypothetical protein